MNQITSELKSYPFVDATTLITGFPGFLTRNLLIRLLQRNPNGTFFLLVEKHLCEFAQTRLDEIVSRCSDFSGKIELVVGDITHPKLALDDETYQKLTKSIEVVWHLAAIYNLAIEEETAYRINVLGTFHILDFCEKVENLKRFNYISTCYVSGKREGIVLEDELECNQQHQNHYESTKFWAEVEVQRRSCEIPTVIFRPAIVVGDSRTGETDKYDGPYYLFRLFMRLPTWVPIPNFLNNGAVVNIVPVDFVADAMAEIGSQADASGVYQLADHRPLTVPEILAECANIFSHPLGPQIVPAKILNTVKGLPLLESALNLPAELTDYFSQQAKYDTLRTRTALQDTSITCPPFLSYIIHLVHYMEAHPDKKFLDGRKR